MCGLLFAYDAARPESGLADSARSAAQLMAHRGPDEGAVITAEGAVIGHRRLSIIDLAQSHQPMRDPSGRFVLAYNGEVYNYRQLKHALSGRWTFSTAGDTETVLAGLVLDGPDFLRRMEGMWALALWDCTQRELLIARDRFGKKPLFYRSDSNNFYGASELPALKHLIGAHLQEDVDSTADYLRYGYFLPGTTAYQGVGELLPGHHATWRPGRPLQQQRYWQLAPAPYTGTPEQARADLREALHSAVQDRLVADVEVGTFLSGGIDSSLVTKLATEHGAGRLRTFSIGFSQASYDERRYARLVADHCDTLHEEACLDRLDADDLEALILRHMGQPFADPSLLPTALVSELASRTVKVVLSGDGADELFGGYQRYQARALLSSYHRLPQPMRRALEKMLGALPEPTAHHSRSWRKKAHLFAEAAAREQEVPSYVAPVLFSPSQIRQLAPELGERGHAAPIPNDQLGQDLIQHMMASDCAVYLPQDILPKVDRASMAHSLEVRSPFLDSRVAELAASIPRRWHRRGFTGKRLLREAFHSSLPPSIWRRRKQGFGVPVGDWFRDELGERLYFRLEGATGPIDAGAVRSMLDLHRSGARDLGLRLWAVHVYLLWQDAQ